MSFTSGVATLMEGAAVSAGCFFPLHDASIRTDKAIRAILTDVFIFVFFSLINYLS
jgi:hypothetical protein